MTGLMKRILRRRAADQPPRAGVASLLGRRLRSRLPGYRRLPSLGLVRLRERLSRPAPTLPAAVPVGSERAIGQVAAPVAVAPSFHDRSRLRRRLRFLRRARELGFRDVGGLIFDMRRFGRNRPDLLDAKLDALLAVDQELRALERILDDRRAIHTLHEPGIAACARCGALHSSESRFCPQCGLQVAGPRAMGELEGAIAAPPQPAIAPNRQEWPWPAPPAVDQPTAQTVAQPTTESVAEQQTVAYVRPASDGQVAPDQETTQTNLPPQASDGP